MSQFTVYKNLSGNHLVYPYLVDVQHSVLSDLPTRVVIPLARTENYLNIQIKGLLPVIEFSGEKLVLMTHQLSSVPCSELKQPLGSLAYMHSDVISALDFLISGF